MVEKPHILVIGAGFGGLEAAFYLRMRMPEARITIVSEKSTFLYRPDTIYIPFGLDPEKIKISLPHPLQLKQIDFVQDRVLEIDPENKLVIGERGQLPYDYLIVATGAGVRMEEIPGLAAHAHTIWTPEGMLELRAALHEMVAASRSRRQQVLFLVPPNNKWSTPLYEIALMLETWLRRNGYRDAVELTWTTVEAAYLEAFGPRVHDVVCEEFEKRGISAWTKMVVQEIGLEEVRYESGERLPYDLLVALPPYIGATPFPGLPADDRGFLQTEMATRQVVGHPDIYAVGDAGDFPVKQAFLAFLQADAAAEHLASHLLGSEPQFAFDPVSMALMEQFDKATFAQVPLEVSGDPEQPVRLRRDAEEMYRVGSGPAWRLGKKLFGAYLPWRYEAGQPFHAGLPWKGVEAGLKVMAGVLAD
ncbi:MAG: FAD-dependent oxidoreductase [Candidatus Promineifilaceae bacterium]|nr:FAD-dependent oxidoreductase [Candidatus Promineifilaceae bacterium]